ncbi:MAG: motif protein [Verrucomicrobia bacterium]|nr:motif protein [Verrucomicrobiota bacterium]
MRFLRHWKIVVVLLGIVLASGYAGARFGYDKAKRDMRARHNPEQWNERAMRGIEEGLKLSPEQRQKIQRLIDAAVDDMKVVRVETVERTTGIVKKLVVDVENELTEEQRVKFSKMKPKQSDMSLDLLKVEPRKK